MSDEALRTLERAAASDPAQTLAYARALERAGRGDEAWIALCRAVDQPDVRAELAARPAWTHRGGPGQTHALDVPPVRRAPRVRWEARVAVVAPCTLASPLGLVVMSGRGQLGELLDPRDGRILAPGSPALENPWLHGGLLLAGSIDPRPALHAWSLHEPTAAPQVERVQARDRPWRFRLVGGEGAATSGELSREGRPLELPPEHLGPVHAAAPLHGGDGWLVAWPANGGGAGTEAGRRVEASIVGGTLLLTVERAGHQFEVLGYDLPRDSLTWRATGRAMAHDRLGALLLSLIGSTRRLALIDQGQERWAVQGRQPLALGRDVVVTGCSREVRPEVVGELFVLDRATGAQRGVIREVGVRPDEQVVDPRVVIARDVIHVSRRCTVTTYSLDGALLWAYDGATVADPMEWVADMALLPGALVVGVTNHRNRPGRVLCLEEGP